MTAPQLPSRLDTARRIGREVLGYVAQSATKDAESAVEQVTRLSLRLGAAESALKALLCALDQQEPGSTGEPECLAARGNFLCTLSAGHPGNHEAHGTRPLLTWSQDEAPFGTESEPGR
jgi:hypothetical protein